MRSGRRDPNGLPYLFINETTTTEKFQEHGGRLKTDDVDFDAFRRTPLHPGHLLGAWSLRR